MSDDTRFDGKHIYTCTNKTSFLVYAIRGKYIYKANASGPPEYEIQGDLIRKAASSSSPAFEICGLKIRKLNSNSDLYEIRD